MACHKDEGMKVGRFVGVVSEILLLPLYAVLARSESKVSEFNVGPATEDIAIQLDFDSMSKAKTRLMERKTVDVKVDATRLCETCSRVKWFCTPYLAPNLCTISCTGYLKTILILTAVDNCIGSVRIKPLPNTMFYEYLGLPGSPTLSTVRNNTHPQGRNQNYTTTRHSLPHHLGVGLKFQSLAAV